MFWKPFTILCSITLGLCSGCGTVLADEKLITSNESVIASSESDATSLVNPFIGTAGHGHTYPGATVPFGMVQLSPDTGIKGWDWCSGYNQSDKSILGFSHTHLSGTGCGDLGDILFAPTVGDVVISTKTSTLEKPPYASQFSHANEIACPGYYSVKLDRDGGIKAELTATARTGMHRYTFPETEKANIIINLTHGIGDEPVELQMNFVGDRTVTGLRRSKGWAQDQYVYFAAEFSQPFTDFGTITEDDTVKRQNRSARGKKLAGFATFKTKPGEPVLARVALSTTSIEGAQLNLKTEAPTWNFDQVRRSASSQWNKELTTIAAQSSDKKELETFYTALYHTMLAPTIISDVDGSYRGSDHQVHQNKKFATYSTFSLWDTFRAEQPLFTLTQPGLVNAFIASLLTQGQDSESKTLPIWPLYANETYCMIGYHSFPVIAEAYRKGFRDWDSKEMLKLMVANTKRNDGWSEKGYISADKEDQSVSKTLEFAYDDWALAQYAKDLGDDASSTQFTKRGQAYKNVFDSKIGFVRGRMNDGAWRTPFDPANSKPGALHDFTEGNAWQYTFFAPHDMPGLIEELGGRKAFVKKLDDFFATTSVNEKDLVQDFTGVIGQYAHGNEPSHQIAYLYDYAGEPWKTQQKVRQIREQLYSNALDGLCGNEDCGQMSAWYVFSALGFYPVNPVTGQYVIGVPGFSKVVLHVADGKTFTVTRDSNKKYIDKVSLNGRPLSRVYLSHNDIISGGSLEFSMTDRPGGKWGTREEDVPQ